MKTRKITLEMLLLYFLLSCNTKVSKQDAPVRTEPLHEVVKVKSNNDAVIIKGHRLTLQEPKGCNQIKDKSAIDELTFVNTNIAYYKTDTIIANQLKIQEYYKTFLQQTDFLEIEESNFYSQNFNFSLDRTIIKNYGECFIGKFYFPFAINAAQRRATVIINTDKKEISIWNFDNINVSTIGLDCDFNVRGKHTIYKLIYSLECNSFVVKS